LPCRTAALVLEDHRFICDETKKLCATGYEMSQKKSLLPAEQFVFASCAEYSA